MSYSVIFLSNIAELKSRRGNSVTSILATINGVNYPLDEAFAVYQWQDDSTATTDDFQIVGSLLGDPNIGRWLRVDNAQMPQINADYNSTSGPAFIFNKPDLTVYALTTALAAYATNSALSSALSSYVSQTSLTTILNSYVQTSTLANYATTASLSGYATNTALGAKYNTPTGTTLQYLRGDGSLATFPLLFDGTYASLTGKPTLFNGAYSSLSGIPTFATVAATGAYSDLSGKPTIPAAQVQSDWNATTGLGVVLNKPTIQAIQRIRAQTSTTGAYTWTFPVAYGTGIIPVVEISVEDNSGAQWSHNITALTNTSMTIQLTKTTAVTVVGISVLGIAATPQAYVHLTAVAP